MAEKNIAPVARKAVLIALSDYENALDSFPSEHDPKTDRSAPPPRQPASEPGLDFFRSENSPAAAATSPRARASVRSSGAGWIAWIGAACGAILLSYWLGQLAIPSLMHQVDTARDPQTQVARAPTLPSAAPAPTAPSVQSGPPPAPSARQPATTRAPAPPSQPAPVIHAPGRVEVPTTPVAPPRSGGARNPVPAAPASPPVTPPPTTAPDVAPAPPPPAAASSTESRAPAPTVSSAPEPAPVTPPRASAPATAAPVPPPPADIRAANSPPPAPAPVVTDEMAVSSTLERYRAAYSQLNAAGAKAVWPSVDERTLSKAFDQLESQDIVFTGCRVLVAGDRANAVCSGNAAFVPKVGARTPRVAYREWNFDLRRVGDRWVISAVGVR